MDKAEGSSKEQRKAQAAREKVLKRFLKEADTPQGGFLDPAALFGSTKPQ